MTFLKSKLTRQLLRRVTLTFLFSISLFIIFYQFVFPTYYYWKLEQPVKQARHFIETNQLDKISDEVVVVKETLLTEQPEEAVTNNLSFSLNREGITLNKFWLDQQAQEQLLSGQVIQRLYHQGKQKNDFYSLFFVRENQLYLIGCSIPSFQEAVGILLPIIMTVTIIFLLVFVVVLISYVQRELILPIRELEQVTQQMSALNFQATNVQTKNELGTLGVAMNQMAQSLQEYQQSILNQNEQLQSFSANLAHELKTPLAVSQLLLDAEKIGLSSETFISELEEQIITMQQRVNQMLEYSMQLQQEMALEKVSIEKYIQEQVEHFQKIDASFTIETEVVPKLLTSQPVLLQMILGNLMTNSLKYSVNNQLLIEGQVLGNHYQLIFRNKALKIDNQLLSKLMQPFVVGEASRNKYLSGTGLGLSIVQQATEKLGGHCYLESTDQHFSAVVLLPL